MSTFRDGQGREVRDISGEIPRKERITRGEIIDALREAGDASMHYQVQQALYAIANKLEKGR